MDTFGSTVALVLCALGGSPEALLDAPANPRLLQTLAVDGLTNKAQGTVYPADSLEQGGMPLGGLGTGYLCLDPDGRFGKTSIFNRLPSPMSIRQPFLSLRLGGREIVLATAKDGVGDAKETRYHGHFPVADMRFFTDLPLSIGLRAQGAFLPGDSIESNTPAAVFEVRVKNTSGEDQEPIVVFSPGGFPAGERTAFAAKDWSGIRVTHAPLEGLPAWVKHEYAIAVEGGRVEDGSKVPAVSAGRRLKPGESGVVRFVLAWYQPYLREASGRVEKHQYATRFADASRR
jgi:hypothetical protein